MRARTSAPCRCRSSPASRHRRWPSGYRRRRRRWRSRRARRRAAGEVCYQADAGPDDRIHFVTDMGWIMGPWTVVGGHAMGSTLVFAEGAPDWPADRLWRLIESEQVSVLGISPTLTRALIPQGEPQT